VASLATSMRLAVLVATSISEPGQRATSRTIQGQLKAISKRVQEKGNYPCKSKRLS
jgi:hypothetical protein